MREPRTATGVRDCFGRRADSAEERVGREVTEAPVKEVVKARESIATD